MRCSVVGLYSASKSSYSPHQQQTAAEGFGGADAVFEQGRQAIRIADAQHVLKRGDYEIAAMPTLRKR
ncbi:MAG: hypothetical protein ACYCZT_09780 [Thiobacillus sp.]